MLFLIILSLFIFLFLFFPWAGAIFLYFYRKNSRLDANIKKIIKKEHNEKLLFYFLIELENTGRFHALILDCQSYIFGSSPFQNSKVIYNGKENYFDTIILKPGKKENLWIHFEIPNINVKTLAVKLSYYDLKPIRFFYKEFKLENNINKTRNDEDLPKIDSINIQRELDLIEKGGVFCLKTPIITHYDGIDYLVDILILGLDKLQNKGVNGKILICIAESLVAILQGRAKSVFEIQPSECALIFNHYFNEDSSLSSPYALELVLKEIGFLRFYFSLYWGILGKLLGIKGMFYIVAGRKAAAVDDAGGTVRPYDKFVVLAPDKPNQFSLDLKRKLIDTRKKKTQFIEDFEIFVVDANDLGRVDILGGTTSLYNKFIIEKLKTNPQGNDDQQTPIVFIPAS